MARATGQQVGKRQVEELTARAAVDFDGFYATRQPPPAADPGDVLVLSCDGKGVVMRADALRPATAAAAGKATSKLASRLSKGEKRNRKRMAEVGAVYDASPAPRTSPDILPANQDLTRTRRTRPGHQQQVADRQRRGRRRTGGGPDLRRGRAPRPRPRPHLDRSGRRQ